MGGQSKKINGEVLLKAEGVHKRFKVGEGELEVLKGIDMEVKRGEFAIIFGPSGCGKSTLLHTLIGLEPPSEGRVIFDGEDFYTLNEDERSLYRRSKVGMIYQQPLWISSLNVRENVELPLRLVNAEEEFIKKKVDEVLELVGMKHREGFVPTELSAGEQQKISLARALVIDPLVIIADEPTGNLDSHSGFELLKTFLKLIEMGKTIVMVTHDLSYLPYGTVVYHMVDGEIVERVRPKNKKVKLETGIDVRDKNFLKNLGI